MIIQYIIKQSFFYLFIYSLYNAISAQLLKRYDDQVSNNIKILTYIRL